jgi:hypothetical protein
VVRGARPGRYRLRALPFAQFPGGDKKGSGGPTPNQTVLTVISTGPRIFDRLPNGPLSAPTDLRRMHVDRFRQIIFSEKESPPKSGNFLFLLNHHTFDPDYVPVPMTALRAVTMQRIRGPPLAGAVERHCHGGSGETDFKHGR